MKKILEQPAVHILFIVCLGVLVYSNTLHVPFHEDARFIVDNPFVKDIGFPIEALRNDTELYSHLKHRYIGFLTFALNYKLHGFDLVGYHVFNIAIHLLNALLVYAFVALIFKTPLLKSSALKEKSLPLALFSSLLFVAHPIQTEAVNFIWQRPSILVAFFYLLSSVTYLKSRLEETRWKGYVFFALSVSSAVLAMKTKQNAFTLPFVIGFLELYFFSGCVRERLIRLAPFALTLFIIPLTFYFAMVSTIGQATTGVASGPLYYLSRSEYLITQCTVVARYIRLLLLPIHQIFHHLNYPLSKSFFDVAVLSSFLFLCALFGLALYLLIRYRSKRADCVLTGIGIVWFFVAISIESSIFPIGILSAEYRIYLPSVGFVIAIVFGSSLIVSRYKSINRLAVTIAFLLIVIVLAGAAYMRNDVWRSELSLWQSDMKLMPDWPFGHYFLAKAYERAGMSAEAAKEYQVAYKLDQELGPSRQDDRIQPLDPEKIQKLKMSLKPDDAESHYKLAEAYYLDKQPDKALSELQVAVSINPRHVAAYYHRGLIYHELGRYADAVKEYKTVLDIMPDNYVVLTDLGSVYAQLGRYEEAMHEIQTALRLKPDYAEAHRYMGMIFQDLGRLEDAVQELVKAVTLKPDYAEAHNNLGEVYMQRGKYEQAYKECRIALDLKPDLNSARKNLDLILEKTGGKANMPKYHESEER